MIDEEELTIVTQDDIHLSTLLISPSVEPLGVVQFHAGTVIRKEFYLKFARFLSDQGFIVVLFDYRGVGGSRPTSLRRFNASIYDWGRKDATAVLDWIKDKYPHLPIHLFAHSMGGQIIGLMYNWPLFEKIVVVASSSGNWHNFDSSYRRKISISTNLMFPINLFLFGYVPGRFGLGQDWPKGVAKDWWKNSQENGLMADHLTAKHGNVYYKVIDKKIDAYFIEDDHMATTATIPNFQKSYPNSTVTTILLKPFDYQFDSIGHFGLFKDWSKGKLWSDVISSFTSSSI